MSIDETSDEELADRVDAAIVATRFSGVVRIDRGGRVALERAAGLADRRWSIPMEMTTRLGLASGAKGFTALTTMALVERGTITLDTPVRRLLGSDLPLIDDGVTVEHLLGHRSGIGDYIDEEVHDDISEHVMPVPVHQLDSAEAYLAVLDGFPQVSPPGSRFTYNNGGFAVLAVVVERAAGTPFARLVDELVIEPAGLVDTGFIRSDALPPGTATGYLDLEGMRTNALHLPLLGTGDGGIFSTTADIATLWTSLYGGRIVNDEHVDLMTRPHSDDPEDGRRYGLGFWLAAAGPVVLLVGYDAGVSFSSLHDPTTGTTCTAIANTSEGAWDLRRRGQRAARVVSARWRHPGWSGAAIYAVAAGLVGAVLTVVARVQVAGARSRAAVVRTLPDGPVIVISNHTSYVDGLLLAIVCRRLGRSARMLATAGVFKAPLVGTVARRIGFIPVNRGAANAADGARAGSRGARCR